MAPKVSAKRLLRFKLRGTDMRGPETVKGADTFPSFVNAWVEPCKKEPPCNGSFFFPLILVKS